MPSRAALLCKAVRSFSEILILILRFFLMCSWLSFDNQPAILRALDSHFRMPLIFLSRIRRGLFFCFLTIFSSIVFLSRLPTWNNCFKKILVFVYNTWNYIGISFHINYQNILVWILLLIGMIRFGDSGVKSLILTNGGPLGLGCCDLSRIKI